MATVQYATQTDVENLLSATGVLLRSDDNEDGSVDSPVMSAVLDRASLWVNQYCRPRSYVVADLATNDWVKYTTTVKAAQLLCRRRGNPVPLAIDAEVEEVLEWLKMIHAGHAEIPDLALEEHSSPAVSNLRVDGRWRQAKLRVQRLISTGGESKASPRNLSYESGLDGPWPGGPWP